MPDIINLVFQGGSVKGIAYTGGLKALQDNEIDLAKIKRIAGTSAGSITASLLALGCTVVQVESIVRDFDFKVLLDDPAWGVPTQHKVVKSTNKYTDDKSVFFSKLPAKVVAPVIGYRLATQSGIYEGEYLRNWIETMIQEQVNKISHGNYDGKYLTFAELHQLTLEYPAFRDLFVVGSNLTTGMKTIFRYNDPRTKDVIISDAVRISMSIPNIFKPHKVYCKIDGERRAVQRPEIWVDGGMHDNYPIDCFDEQDYMETGDLCLSADGKRRYNPETLGFRLVSKERKEFMEGITDELNHPIPNFIAHNLALLEVRSDLQEERYSYPENRDRTVYIDHKGVSMLAFGLSKEKQAELIESGRHATQDYLDKHPSLVPHVGLVTPGGN